VLGVAWYWFVLVFAAVSIVGLLVVAWLWFERQDERTIRHIRVKRGLNRK
jgi:hypothetical protein